MLGGYLKTHHGNVLRRNVTPDKDAYLSEGAPRLVTDTSFIRNQQYHQMSDTIDTLDLLFFCAVVRGLAVAFGKFLATASQLEQLQTQLEQRRPRAYRAKQRQLLAAQRSRRSSPDKNNADIA